MIETIRHLNFRRMEECAQVIRWLDPQPGENILDVGCGDGYYSSLIARKGARVTGIDYSKEAIERAKRTYRKKDIRFIHLDAEKMDFPEASFDKAVSFCVIEHFQNDVLVMELLKKFLKPAGRFVFSADSLSNSGITPEELERHKKRYLVNTFYTKPIVKDKLSQTGFAVEQSHYILTTKVSLALIRFSWKLDHLPKSLRFVRTLGYFFLATAGKITADLTELSSRNPCRGLTLLTSARAVTPLE